MRPIKVCERKELIWQARFNLMAFYESLFEVLIFYYFRLHDSLERQVSWQPMWDQSPCHYLPHMKYCLKKCLNYNTKHYLKIETQEIMKRYQIRDGFCNVYIMSMSQMYKTACGYILSSHKNKESSDLPVYMLCDHHILVLQGRHWMNANEESTFMGGRKFYRWSHHMDENLSKHLIKRILGQNILTFFIHLILFQSKMS